MTDRRTLLIGSLAGLVPRPLHAQTQCGVGLNPSNEVGNPTTTRAAIALRAAAQSIIWIGAEAGIFKKHALT